MKSYTKSILLFSCVLALLLRFSEFKHEHNVPYTFNSGSRAANVTFESIQNVTFKSITNVTDINQQVDVADWMHCANEGN